LSSFPSRLCLSSNRRSLSPLQFTFLSYSLLSRSLLSFSLCVFPSTSSLISVRGLGTLEQHCPRLQRLSFVHCGLTWRPDSLSSGIPTLPSFFAIYICYSSRGSSLFSLSLPLSSRSPPDLFRSLSH